MSIPMTLSDLKGRDGMGKTFPISIFMPIRIDLRATKLGELTNVVE